MDGLRDTAHALEEKHNELLEKVNAQLAVFANSGQSDRRITELQDKLQVAREQAEALKRQNLQFLDEIGDRIKREDRMEGLFRELMVGVDLVGFREDAGNYENADDGMFV